MKVPLGRTAVAVLAALAVALVVFGTPSPRGASRPPAPPPGAFRGAVAGGPTPPRVAPPPPPDSLRWQAGGPPPTDQQQTDLNAAGGAPGAGGAAGGTRSDPDKDPAEDEAGADGGTGREPHGAPNDREDAGNSDESPADLEEAGVPRPKGRHTFSSATGAQEGREESPARDLAEDRDRAEDGADPAPAEQGVPPAAPVVQPPDPVAGNDDGPAGDSAPPARWSPAGTLPCVIYSSIKGRHGHGNQIKILHQLIAAARAVGCRLLPPQMARSSAVIIPIVPMSDLFDLEVARTKDGSGPLFLDIAKRPDDLELLLRLASASGDQKRFNVRALPLSGHENKVPWRLPCLVPTLGAKDARRNWTQPFFCTTFNVFPEPELARYASASEVPESISGPFAGKLWGLTMPFSLNLSCGMELEAASMLPPRKEIVAAAGNFVKQVFGGDPFLTAHVRLGDMLAYCKERLRFPLCGSTWESVLPEMARWMADAGVRSAFVAGVADGWDRLGAGVSRQLGDMPPKDNFDASQGIQIVVSATGGNWHMVSVKDTGADPQLRVRVGVRVASDLAAALRDQRLRPSAELVRAAGSDERARKMLGDMAGQIVDQLVLSCGQPFLQTWFSTFGGSAALMRHHMAEHCPDFSAPAPAEDPDDRSTQQAAFEAAGVSFDRLPASVDRKTRPPDRYWAIGCLGRTLPPLGDGTVSTAFFSSIPWRDRLKWKEGEKCHECVGPDHRW